MSFSLISCNSGEVEDSLFENQGSGVITKALWNDASLPLQIEVSNQFSAGEITSVSSSLDEWDNAFNGAQFFSASLPSVADPKHATLESYRDNTLGVYIVESGDPLADDSLDVQQALAVTQFYAMVDSINGESFYRIIHADIFVNDRLYDFSVNPDPSKYDFPSVIVHEMGHLLGLGHIAFGEGESVMNPSISMSTEKRSLFNIDDNSITDLYQDPAASAKVDHDDGKLKSQSNQGAVRVLTMLMPDGECHHYEDGKLKHTHKRKNHSH